MAEGHGDSSDADRLVEAVPVDAAARRRFSVSRLSGELRPADDVPAASLEDDEPTLSAAQAADLGTLVHQGLGAD